MDAGILALLTGLIGTALGAVIIGGAMFGAYLFGKDRGRREALAEAASPRSSLNAEQIARAERRAPSTNTNTSPTSFHSEPVA